MAVQLFRYGLKWTDTIDDASRTGFAAAMDSDHDPPSQNVQAARSSTRSSGTRAIGQWKSQPPWVQPKPYRNSPSITETIPYGASPSAKRIVGCFVPGATTGRSG